MISGHSACAAARMLAICAMICAMGLAFVASAQAQPSQAQLSAVKSHCRSDYMSNCMSVRPGGKEALECLQSHLDSLTGACKDAVSATMPPPPAAAAPPPAPPPPKAAAAPPRRAEPPPAAAAAPPAMTAPPPPKAATAPKAKKTKTAKHTPAPPSPPVAIAPPPGPDPAVLLAKAEGLPARDKLKIARACDQDQAAVCPSVRRGGGRLIACMAMHPDALSPICRRTLEATLQ